MTIYKRTLIATILSLLMTAMTYAGEYKTQGNYVYDIVEYFGHDGKEAVIMGLAPGFKPTGEVVIPGTVTIDGETYPVTKVGDYFNYYNEPPTLPAVFTNLPGLTSVVIPDELTRISPNEFENCPALKEFKVKSGNKDYFARDGLLYGISSSGNKYLVRIPPAKNLTTFTLPSDIHYAQEYAFAGSTKLKTIVLSGDQVLDGCWQLGNKSIENVDVSKSTYYDPKRSKNGFIFYGGGFASLSSVAPGVKMDSYTVPDDMIYIEDGAFANSSIKKVVLKGENLTGGIPAAAFQCSDIESITIPGSLSYEIFLGAFFNCKKLTSVTLEAHDRSEGEIYRWAFYGCTNLKTVTIESKAPLAIKRYAFNDCQNLSAFTLPSGATISHLGEYAFQGCKSLKTFSLLPVKEMEDRYGHQFANSGLTKVNWPSALPEVPKGCFYNCQSLKEVNFKESTTTVSWDAFRNTALETLNLAGVSHVLLGAFVDCPDLRKIVIPKNPEPVSICNGFSCDVEGTQLIINTPLRHVVSGNEPMKFSNVDVYTSNNGTAESTWDIFLPYKLSTIDYDIMTSDWKSVNVPAHTAKAYQEYSVKPVKEMFSYYNDPAKKTATVTSLNPIVSIKGVTIEGIAATQSGNVWSAPKAVISSKDKMNVTIDYTVNGAKMQTTYTEVYSAASTDDMMMSGYAATSITLNGRTADFGTDTHWNVYTLQGASVASGSGRSADLGNLPAGMYVIRAGGSALKTILK